MLREIKQYIDIHPIITNRSPKKIHNNETVDEEIMKLLQKKTKKY